MKILDAQCLEIRNLIVVNLSKNFLGFFLLGWSSTCQCPNEQVSSNLHPDTSEELTFGRMPITTRWSRSVAFGNSARLSSKLLGWIPEFEKFPAHVTRWEGAGLHLCAIVVVCVLVQQFGWCTQAFGIGVCGKTHGPRLYVCQAPNAFICVSSVAPPKHQMRLYVCHQMRLYVCHQMRLYVCHQMRLYVCH